jgi:hypothetical protein
LRALKAAGNRFRWTKPRGRFVALRAIFVLNSIVSAKRATLRGDFFHAFSLQHDI